MKRTAWKVEHDQVTLYLNQILNIFGVVSALFTLALVYISINHLTVNNLSITLFIAIFIAATILFFLSARTCVVFDRSRHIMQVKLFGILPVKTIAFADIAGIQAVHNAAGSFNYRIYRTDELYGKGCRISGGYGKETNKNAIALLREVFPVIEQYLSEVHPVQSAVPAGITTYRFYTFDQGSYIVKVPYTSYLINSTLFLACGIYIYIRQVNFGNYSPAFLAFVLVSAGIILLLATTKKTVLDVPAKKIKISYLAGINRKEYHFNDFQGFSILRRTVNFVYAGTDVRVKFKSQNPNKVNMVLLHTVKKPKDIEQFIKETESLLVIRDQTYH